MRVCSPASRLLAPLCPRGVGLSALTPAPRTLVQIGPCRRCPLLHPSRHDALLSHWLVRSSTVGQRRVGRLDPVLNHGRRRLNGEAEPGPVAFAGFCTGFGGATVATSIRSTGDCTTGRQPFCYPRRSNPSASMAPVSTNVAGDGGGLQRVRRRCDQSNAGPVRAPVPYPTQRTAVRGSPAGAAGRRTGSRRRNLPRTSRYRGSRTTPPRPRRRSDACSTGTARCDPFRVRIPVKKATHSGNKKPPGGWSNPDTATIAGWLF